MACIIPPPPTTGTEWDGETSSDWDDPTNYNPDGIPTNGTNVVIDDGNYTNAPVISPGDAFTPGIIVMAGNGTLTVNDDRTVTGIEIQGTGTTSLSVSTGNTITINGDIVLLDAGAQTFVGDGDASATGSLIFETGSTNATITNNLTGSLSLSADIIVESDFFTLAQDGNSIVNNGTLSFGNIDLEDGDFNLDNNNTIDMNGTFVNVDAGSLFNNYSGATWNYSGNGHDTDVVLDCNIDGANLFNYDRNNNQQIIPTSNGYVNLTTSGAGNKRMQANLDINGDLLIEGDSRLDSRGGGNWDMNLAGDWIINTTAADPFNERGRTVTFDGGSQQEIRGTTAVPLTFRNVTFNTAGLTLSLPVIVELAGTATFTNGVVTSDATNLFTIDDGGASTGGNAGSFVDGPVQKIGNTDFVFPTGEGSKWARIGITNLSGSETFTAEYNESVFSDVSVSGLNRVSAYEHWELTRTGAQTASVTLYWEDGSTSGSDITDIGPTDLVVASYNGADWVSEGQTTPINGTTAAGDITTNANVAANYSVFTFGSLTGLNPLPIELLSFTARQSDEIVVLEWKAATELNNDFYTLERSYNGIDFDEIARVQGAGTSATETQYTREDYPAFSGLIYYRLTQTDFDGTFETFDLVSVNFEKNSTRMELFPNPTNEEFVNVVLPRDIEGNVLLRVFSVAGETLFEQEYEGFEGNITLNVTTLNGTGVYVVTANSRQGNYQARLIVE